MSESYYLAQNVIFTVHFLYDLIMITSGVVLLFCSCLTLWAASEIYKETLVKALAKHFHARLLIVDSITLCDVSSTPVLIQLHCQKLLP